MESLASSSSSSPSSATTLSSPAAACSIAAAGGGGSGSGGASADKLLGILFQAAQGYTKERFLSVFSAITFSLSQLYEEQSSSSSPPSSAASASATEPFSSSELAAPSSPPPSSGSPATSPSSSGVRSAVRLVDSTTLYHLLCANAHMKDAEKKKCLLQVYRQGKLWERRRRAADQEGEAKKKLEGWFDQVEAAFSFEKVLQNRSLPTSVVHLAAEAGEPRTLHFLLTHGARVATKDKKGATPLHAVMKAPANHEECLYILLSSFAKEKDAATQKEQREAIYMHEHPEQLDVSNGNTEPATTEAKEGQERGEEERINKKKKSDLEERQREEEEKQREELDRKEEEKEEKEGEKSLNEWLKMDWQFLKEQVVRSNNKKQFQKLLAVKDKKGTTALHWATHSNKNLQAKCVKPLVIMGAISNPEQTMSHWLYNTSCVDSLRQGSYVDDLKYLCTNFIAKECHDNKEAELEVQEEMDRLNIDESLRTTVEEEIVLYDAQQQIGKHHMFKVIMLGAQDTGKSSLALTWTQGKTTQSTISTLGAAFLYKEFDLGSHTVNLELWDTSGAEQYDCMNKIYCADAHAAILFYDRPANLSKVKFWIAQLREKAPENLIIYIVATKADMYEIQRDPASQELMGDLAPPLPLAHEKGMHCAEKWRCQHWVALSSKKNIQQVNRLFTSLGANLLQLKKKIAYQTMQLGKSGPFVNEAIQIKCYPWQNDAISEVCTKCRSRFTVLHRKHHCRRCGQLYCGDCTATRQCIPHTSFDKKSVRICEDCKPILFIHQCLCFACSPILQ